jgi:hypothetical protein
MPRNRNVWILCSVAVLVATLAIMQTMTARSAIAQQPNPTPTPDPKPSPTPPENCSTCCGVLQPGGLTIAGPASGQATPGTHWHNRVVFFPGRNNYVCLTLQNTSSSNIFPGVIPFGTADDSVDREALSFPILPGQTLTYCPHTAVVLYTVICAPESITPCTFNWRVDKAD